MVCISVNEIYIGVARESHGVFMYDFLAWLNVLYQETKIRRHFVFH